MTARGALFATALALVSTLAAASLAAAQAARDLSKEGVEAFRSGDYARSQRLLREYVEANADKKGSDSAHLGEAYHYLGLMTPDAKLAEGYFLAVAQRYPASPVADESTARLAQLYGALGRYTDARREWNALATNYPLSRHVPVANLRIGQMYFAEGDLQNAYNAFTSGFSKMKIFQRSGGGGADLSEIEGEYVFWLGRTLLARKAYGDARKYFNLVLLDYPNHPLESVTLYYLSQANRGDGKTKEADDAWLRFSESVRNTSLEPVAQNPNLIAIAGARETGALNRPPEADARVAERRAAQAKAEGGEPVDEGQAPPRAATPEPAGGALTGGGNRDEAPGIEPRATGAASDRVLRAPEPGRAGGVVEDEPAESPAGETPAAGKATGAGVGAENEKGEAPGKGVASQAEPQATAEVLPPAAREPSAEERARLAQVETRGQELLGRSQGVSQPTGKEAARPEPLPAIRGEPVPKPAAPAGGAARPTKPVEPAQPAAAPDRALESIEPGAVYLQVGAFTSAASAAQMSTELRKKKFTPSISSGLRNGKAFYRVRLGPYEVPHERETLETQRSALLKAGYVPAVTRREAGGESGR